MGMFDEIYFEQRLPMPEGLDREQYSAVEKFLDEDVFQTKDLDNSMGRYVVTIKGILREVIKYSDSTSFYQESDPISLNENIRCYAIINVSDEKKFWIEYQVAFSNGIMKNAQLIKWHQIEE